MIIPGFPSNTKEWYGEEVGLALAGLVARDNNNEPREGVICTTSALITKGPGWTSRVARHQAIRKVGFGVLIGGSDEVVALSHQPAPSANARIDVIYEKVGDAGDGESTVIAVATGVAQAVPAKPSIPSGAIELGTLTVRAGNTGIAQAVLAITAKTTAAAGGIIRFRDNADRDAFDAVDGQFGCVGTRTYQKFGTTWRRVGGSTRNGVASVTVPSGKSGATTVVPLPAGAFDSPPRVFVTKQSGALANYHAYADKITADSLTVGVFYGPGDASGTRTVNIAWEAVES